MNTIRKGARGRDIVFLQIALNTHLQLRPMLRVDGLFGDLTEKAVRQFQRYAGIVANGIVDQQTWRALTAPEKVPAPNLKKFQSQLRPASDFVAYLQGIESPKRNTAQILEAVSDFRQTNTGGRYLLIRGGMIDFRHFFAAAGETYGALTSRRRRIPIGGGRGCTLLLGVANELSQCVDEMLEMKLNSCFSPEDLGSNRLGADFGRSLLVSKAEASRLPVSRQLQVFLEKTGPMPPKAVGVATVPGIWATAAESVTAIVIGILDALIPDAY